MYFKGHSGIFILVLFINIVFEYGGINVEAIAIELKTGLQKHWDSMNWAYDKVSMDSVSFSCKTDAAKLVLDWYPTPGIRWKHNGENLQLKMNRMTYSVDSLSIQNLVPSDSGVYSCDMLISDTQNVSVAFYSIVVGSEHMNVYTGDSMSLDCHSVALGELFTTSIRQWWHGRTKVGSPKPATDTSIDTIDSEDEYSGDWYCEVQDPRTKRTWTTARYKVTMKPPLPLLKRMRKYAKTHRRETMAIIASSCFGTVMLINIITSFLDKRKAAKNKEMDYFKKSLGMDGFGPDTVPLIPKGSKVEGENDGSKVDGGEREMGSSSESETSSDSTTS